MDILNQLQPIVDKSQKRRGRGIGSGVGGHTTGRGNKGDKVRGKTKITFDGTKIKKGWIKRLPFLRGKHRNLKRSIYSIFSLSQIDTRFSQDATVSPETLKANNIKILGGGTITKALKFENVRASASAKKKIIAAGGTISS